MKHQQGSSSFDHSPTGMRVLVKEIMDNVPMGENSNKAAAGKHGNSSSRQKKAVAAVEEVRHTCVLLRDKKEAWRDEGSFVSPNSSSVFSRV